MERSNFCCTVSMGCFVNSTCMSIRYLSSILLLKTFSEKFFSLPFFRMNFCEIFDNGEFCLFLLFGLFFIRPRTRSMRLVRVTRFIVRSGRIINSAIVPDTTLRKNEMSFSVSFFFFNLTSFIGKYTS